MDTNDKIKIVASIVVIALVVFIVWRILGKVGLVETLKDKADANKIENLRTSEYFNPMFYKGKSFKPLGKNLAEQYAKQLRSAVRFFGTDEELIYSTFAKMNNKVNISEVAEAYYNLYNTDMQSDVLDELRESELKKLAGIIEKLKNF